MKITSLNFFVIYTKLYLLTAGHPCTRVPVCVCVCPNKRSSSFCGWMLPGWVYPRDANPPVSGGAEVREAGPAASGGERDGQPVLSTPMHTHIHACTQGEGDATCPRRGCGHPGAALSAAAAATPQCHVCSRSGAHTMEGRSSRGGREACQPASQLLETGSAW